jgi:2-hydroxy-6-oxonona-2,4-dienedioate hydrolase
MMKENTMLKEQYLPVNGQRLHVRACERDHVRSLILVPGMGVSSRYMLPLARELAKEPYSVYVVDLPGFGKSRPAADLTMSAMADSILGLISHKKLQEPVLVGNSFGCQVILHILKCQPDIASSAILTGPTMNIYERTYHQQVLRWLQNLRHEPVRRLAGPIAKDMWDCRLWQLFVMLRVGLRDRPEESLQSIKTPLLLARGQLDPIVPRQWLEFLASKGTGIQIAEVPNAAHAIVFDRPAEVTRLIKSFLDGKL